MSHSSLINWFKQLLFGCNHGKEIPPPCELAELIFLLEEDGIYWEDMLHRGGLTNYRYQIQGDLDLLLDSLEKNPDALPVFRTRAVTSFFNHLMCLLSRPRQNTVKDDNLNLKAILEGSSGPFHFESAEFWGNLVQQYLSRNRLPQELQPLPAARDLDLKRNERLYQLTCETRGERLNPFSTFIVPSHEYVNAVHWQSENTLESFMKLRPDHALSQSIQQLVLRALNQFLDGNYPSCLDSNHSKAFEFLQNISVVHDSISEVTLLSPPPRVIDVFQRLLSYARLDDLWQSCSNVPLDTSSVIDTFHLSEKLLLAEKQNKILLQHIPQD